jgi:hypothetical protein
MVNTNSLTAQPMTNQSTSPSDDDIWDELLHSEASQQFLDKLIQQAKEELNQFQTN